MNPNIQYVYMLDFQKKIGEAYLAIANTIAIMSLKNVQEHITGRGMQVFGNIFDELDKKGVFDNLDKKKYPDTKKMIFDKMREENLKTVQDYKPLLLNQNLVMLCTIMEMFFIHILDIILKIEPRTIISLAEEKNIDLKQIIKLKNYNAILDNFRNKILDNFSRQGMSIKFKNYKKIGIEISKVFDYSDYTEEVQRKFNNFDLNKLIEIFDKRHDIVHKNCRSIKNIEELTLIKEFFEKIILNFSIIVKSKFNIPIDIQKPQVDAMIEKIKNTKEKDGFDKK